jgi:hypothetical protein
MGVWNWIKSKASAVGKAIGSAFSSGKKAIASTANAVGSAIKTVYNDGKSAIKTVYKTDTGLLNKVEGDTIGKNGIINKTVGSVTGILSTPLLLVGGGIAAFLFFSGKNSSANLSYSR